MKNYLKEVMKKFYDKSRFYMPKNKRASAYNEQVQNGPKLPKKMDSPKE